MRLLTLLLAVLLPAVTWAQANENEVPLVDPAGEELQVLAIGQVPPRVMDAARRVAPDVFFNGAESYWQDDFRVYRLSGRLFREAWNVYVREDGTVLRTESDNRS